MPASINPASPKSPFCLISLHPSLSSLPMRQVDAEVDRYLVLLGNVIRQRGYTQLEVQQELRWGRSYISQLVTKQKSLRVEQVLLILGVIGIDPAEFFAELYAPPAALYTVSGPAPARVDPGQPQAHQRDFQELRALLGLLVEKWVISGEKLRVAVEAAEREP